MKWKNEEIIHGANGHEFVKIKSSQVMSQYECIHCGCIMSNLNRSTHFTYGGNTYYAEPLCTQLKLQLL